MDPFSTEACTLAFVMAGLLAYRALHKRSLTTGGAVVGCSVGFLIVASQGPRGLLMYVFYQAGSAATKYKASVKAQYDATVNVVVNNNNASSSSSPQHQHQPSAAQAESRSSVTGGGGGRGPGQVLAVTIVAVILSLIHAIYCGSDGQQQQRPMRFSAASNDNDSSSSSAANADGDASSCSDRFASQLACAIVAHWATCLADTLASELGMVTTLTTPFSRGGGSKQQQPQQPILVTQPWRRVPVGTNGGVTLEGTLWSVVGGAAIGVCTVLMDLIAGSTPQYSSTTNMIVFATVAGFVGSLVDSVLGATLQATYYDKERRRVYHAHQRQHLLQPNAAVLITGIDLLTNEQVNFVSLVVTSLIGGWVIGPAIFA